MIILRNNFPSLFSKTKRIQVKKRERIKVKKMEKVKNWEGEGGYVIRFKFYDNSKKQFSFNFGQNRSEKEERISIEAIYSK